MLLRCALPIAALALLACGEPLRNFGDGGLPTDAAPDAATPIDVPVDAPCTSLATTAPDLVAVDQAPPRPAWTGGMLTDGTYVLVAVDQYSASGQPVYRDTIRFVGAGTGGATYERASLTENTTGSWFVNTSFNVLTLTPLCGAPSVDARHEYNFEAATGVLQIFDYVGSGTRVFSYQRQL